MPRARQAGQAGRREALLAAAAAVFAEHGYHAATVAEITRRASVATGTFYLYFPSKEQCFGQLVALFYEKVLREVRGRRRGAPSVAVKLDRSVQAVLQCFREERDLAEIVLVRAASTTKTLQQRLGMIESELVSLLATDLAEAVADGLVPAGDAQLRARLVLGAMREALVYELQARNDLPAADFEVRRFLLRAVGAAGVHVEEEGQTSS
jgi:AcrR family transcriptional regulator